MFIRGSWSNLVVNLSNCEAIFPQEITNYLGDIRYVIRVAHTNGDYDLGVYQDKKDCLVMYNFICWAALMFERFSFLNLKEMEIQLNICSETGYAIFPPKDPTDEENNEDDNEDDSEEGEI